MQGCTPEWRTQFEREATTRDSKKGLKRERGNSGPENFVHPPFQISGSASDSDSDSDSDSETPTRCVQICITSPLMLGLRIVQTLGFKLTSSQQKGLRIDRVQRNEWGFFH